MRAMVDVDNASIAIFIVSSHKACTLPHLRNEWHWGTGPRALVRHILLLCLATIAAGCQREPTRSISSTVAAATTSPAKPASAGWPCYLGPAHNGVSYEVGLLDAFPAEGPQELWRRTIGTSYSSPVVNEQGVILFYRSADRE